MRFADRSVLVAGGTGALGQAVCRAFLAEGARVTAVSRRAPAEGARLAASLGAGGRDRLALVAADVAQPAEAARAIAEVLRGGRLDAVVNAAGGWAGGAAVHEEPEGTLERMLAANLAPGHALLRAALPPMLRQGGGAIVEVASAAAAGRNRGRRPPPRRRPRRSRSSCRPRRRCASAACA
jgi:NAD(P)-dependent dehydrogenase (short-subunit alcohol dehydrogenase family)